MPGGSLERRAGNPGGDKGRREIKLPDSVLQRIVNFDPDERVSPDTEDMRREGVPANTELIYRRQWKRWVTWCGETGREHLPATIGTVREWINAHWTMADATGALRGRNGQPYAPATVELSLAVISVVHQWAGYPSPTRHPEVYQQMRGYRSRWSRKGYRTGEAYALMPEEVLAMVRTCDMTTVAGLRNATIMRMLGDMGARRSEICYLDMGDVRFQTTERLIVHVPRSKTDQDARGRDVPIEADVDLAPDLCPLKLLREWLDLLRARGYTSGPLFRLVHAGQRRKDGTYSGRILDERMTGQAIEEMVVRAARLSGVDVDPETDQPRRVVPHSFRAGLITAASEAGMDTALIAQHTGHSPESPTIFRYVRSGKRWGDNNPATRIRRARRKDTEE